MRLIKACKRRPSSALSSRLQGSNPSRLPLQQNPHNLLQILLQVPRDFLLQGGPQLRELSLQRKLCMRAQLQCLKTPRNSGGPAVLPQQSSRLRNPFSRNPGLQGTINQQTVPGGTYQSLPVGAISPQIGNLQVPAASPVPGHSRRSRPNRGVLP